MGKALRKTDYLKALRWIQRELGVQDWKIVLFVQNEPPGWAKDDADNGTLGMAAAKASYKEADIWVSPVRTEKQKDDPISTLFHEVLHVVAADSGIEDEDSPCTHRKEYVWNKLGDTLAKAYRAWARLPTKI